jgi:hypothetical protein
MNFWCTEREQWVGPRFCYEESYQEDIPFLSDFTTGDILVVSQWDFYLPMHALQYYRAHRRDHHIMNRIDPDDFDITNEDFTYYEKLAECEKSKRIIEILIEDLETYISKEGPGTWFLYKAICEMRNNIPKLKLLKEGWNHKREQIIVYHQKNRFMEFAVLVNKKFYKLGIKENCLTFNILTFMFDLHPYLRPKKSFVIDLNCNENEDEFN